MSFGIRDYRNRVLRKAWTRPYCVCAFKACLMVGQDLASFHSIYRWDVNFHIQILHSQELKAVPGLYPYRVRVPGNRYFLLPNNPRAVSKEFLGAAYNGIETLCM